MNFNWNISNEADFKEFDKWIINNNNFLKDRKLSEVISNTINGCVRPCYCATAKIKKEVCGFVLISHNFNEKPVKQAMIDLIVTNPKLSNNGFGTAMIFDVVKNCEKIFGFKPEKINALVNVTNNSSKKIFLKNYFTDLKQNEAKLSDFDYYDFEKILKDENLTEDKVFKKRAKQVIKQVKK